jgi:hypothetical protein
MLEKKRVLKMFIYNPEDNLYTAKVNAVLKLNLVAKFVAIGVSLFRQAIKLYHSVKEETGMGFWDQLMIIKLDSFVALCAQLIFSTSQSCSRRFGPSQLDLMPETMQVCHILISGCAVTLKVIFGIFTYWWLFPCESDTLVSLLNALAPNSRLQLIGIILISGCAVTFKVTFRIFTYWWLFPCKSDTLVSLLNVLAPNSRHQLIGIATDGASTMTGCIKGTSNASIK